jgi:hypothetical protein
VVSLFTGSSFSTPRSTMSTPQPVLSFDPEQTSMHQPNRSPRGAIQSMPESGYFDNC